METSNVEQSNLYKSLLYGFSDAASIKDFIQILGMIFTELTHSDLSLTTERSEKLVYLYQSISGTLDLFLRRPSVLFNSKKINVWYMHHCEVINHHHSNLPIVYKEQYYQKTLTSIQVRRYLGITDKLIPFGDTKIPLVYLSSFIHRFTVRDLNEEVSKIFEYLVDKIDIPVAPPVFSFNQSISDDDFNDSVINDI